MRQQQRFEEKPKERTFPTSYTPTKTHPIRPCCKRVTIWIKEIKDDLSPNSLDGLSCSSQTLGEQYKRLLKESKEFKTFPAIDKMFYFLLGTQSLTFLCQKKDGRVFKVETDVQSIPSEQWIY